MNNQKSPLITRMPYRILIVFYSHSGITEKVSRTIWKEADGDLYQIRTIDKYTKDAHELSQIALGQRESKKLPKLQDNLSGFSAYDLIIVGGPVWSETVSTPLMSFLARTNFKGRAVAPLWTSSGRPDNYEKDFTSQIHSAVLLPGLKLENSTIDDKNQLIRSMASWLNNLQVEAFRQTRRVANH